MILNIFIVPAFFTDAIILLLPATGVRFRLPLFRLVIDKNAPKNGRGILPEVASTPTVEAIIRNTDFKVEKAMELIGKDKKPHQ